MKALGCYLTIPVYILLALGTLHSLESVAQGPSITNGYVCAPKNIGGEDTRLYFRQQDGVAENLSKTATFPVVCPVVITYDSPPYFVTVAVGQGSDFGQDFACSLEEYTGNAFKVRGIGKSVYLPPGGSDALSWENVYLQDPSNYLSLRCILPPRGGISGVLWY